MPRMQKKKQWHPILLSILEKFELFCIWSSRVRVQSFFLALSVQPMFNKNYDNSYVL